MAEGAARAAAVVTIEDRVRQRTDDVALGDARTVDELTLRLVAAAGLPTRTLDGSPIRYELTDLDDAPLDPAARLEPDLAGSTWRLVSDEGAATWGRVKDILGRIEDEIGSSARDAVDGVVEDRVDQVRDFLRNEASRRVRGIGSTLDWRSRRRVRRLARELGVTDAFPHKSEDIIDLAGRIGPLAGRAARVAVPLVVGAGAATAGAGVYAVADEDLTEADVEDAVADALAEQDPSTLRPAPAEQIVFDTDQLTVLAAAVANEIELPTPDRLAREDLEALLAALAETDPVSGSILGGTRSTAERPVVDGDGSLWRIAEGVRAEALAGSPPAGCPPVTAGAESLAAYVLRFWSANVDVLGADPDALDVGSTLRVPCPR